MEFDYDPSQDGRTAEDVACNEVFFMAKLACEYFSECESPTIQPI
jgi:hypothetical protein